MRRVALLGNPNVGKSTLFNALTGSTQRTGNYPGVTVDASVGEWKVGGEAVELLDLPGAYSLTPHSPDEALAIAALRGLKGLPAPQALLAIVDASNPERNLYLLSQLLDLGLPTVVALNMGDVAASRGLAVDAAALSRNLGVRVVPVQANQRQGLDSLEAAMARCLEEGPRPLGPGLPIDGESAAAPDTIRSRYAWARRMLFDALTRPEAGQRTLSDRLDSLLTHRFWGGLAFLVLMTLVFQGMYAWAQPLMEGMEALVNWLGSAALAPLPAGALKDLLSGGVVAGVGAVLVFLPQIALLFVFIGILEDCGYMARTAFLMDKLFARIGLSGRSFIPLLSSYACAVPGILATRTIADRRERLVTMLIAPLMSCSARLPVYTLMIAAFIPATVVGGFFRLQALVLLGMYLLGLGVAAPVAWVLRKRLSREQAPFFLIELPSYKWPDWRVVLRRAASQCREFVVQAGSLILAVAILVWALGYFPRSPALAQAFEARRSAIIQGAMAPAYQGEALKALEREEASARLRQSLLGRAGHAVEPLFAPLGWDWRIGMAALASFPAREVVIATLATIFNASEADSHSNALRSTLASAKREDGTPLFNAAVALSLMVFFALCAQCASTLAVIARESGHWGWAAFTFFYMTLLAWLGAWGAFHLARVMGA